MFYQALVNFPRYKKPAIVLNIYFSHVGDTLNCPLNKLWHVVKGMFDIVPCPTENPTTDVGRKMC